MTLADDYERTADAGILFEHIHLDDDWVLSDVIEPDGSRDVVMIEVERYVTQRRFESIRYRAPHEGLGRLSRGWRERIFGGALRCGRPCADGHPCRSMVARPGEACRLHRPDGPLGAVVLEGEP
jgi:hypothetical protein